MQLRGVLFFLQSSKNRLKIYLEIYYEKLQNLY